MTKKVVIEGNIVMTVFLALIFVLAHWDVFSKDFPRLGIFLGFILVVVYLGNVELFHKTGQKDENSH